MRFDYYFHLITNECDTVRLTSTVIALAPAPPSMLGGNGTARLGHIFLQFFLQALGNFFAVNFFFWQNKPNRTKLAVQLTAKRAKFKHSSVVRTKLLLLGFTFTDDASSSCRRVLKISILFSRQQQQKLAFSWKAKEMGNTNNKTKKRGKSFFRAILPEGAATNFRLLIKFIEWNCMSVHTTILIDRLIKIALKKIFFPLIL